MPEEPMVMVLVDNDEGLVAFARSLLHSEGIKHYVRNLYIQDLFGSGRLGWNTAVWPAQIIVHASDAESAREILSDLVRVPRNRLPLNLYLIAIALFWLIGLVVNIKNSINR